MGHFPGVIRVMVIMGLCATCFAGGTPEEVLTPPSEKPWVSENTPRMSGGQAPEFTDRADWVYKASDWVLNLYITQKESHGVLFFEGKEVKGRPGEIRALPIGTVEYNGSVKSGATLRDNSGWQMKDPLVKPVINTPSHSFK